MGAEEQKEMFNRMKQMKESAAQTSEIMFRMVKELLGITEVSLGANQSIAEEAERLLQGSTENTKAVENADGKIQDITGQLMELSNMNHRTAMLTDQIGENIQENQKRMDDATDSMEQNAIYTQKGMESIQKANESATIITSSNKELTEQIHEIDKVAEIIRIKSGEVADNMKQISNNTQENCNAVEQVSAATQENTAGTESLAEIVEQIKGLSEQLNQVVQG